MLSQEVKERIDSYKGDIAAVKKIDKLVKLVKSVIPQNARIYVYSADVNVYMDAKSMDEVKRVLKDLARKKIMVTSAYDLDVSPNWYLKKDGVYGTVYFRPTFATEGSEAEGTTCKLVKVGEETVTNKRPIYKLICDDKPAEPVAPAL